MSSAFGLRIIHLLRQRNPGEDFSQADTLQEPLTRMGPAEIVIQE